MATKARQSDCLDCRRRVGCCGHARCATSGAPWIWTLLRTPSPTSIARSTAGLVNYLDLGVFDVLAGTSAGTSGAVMWARRLRFRPWLRAATSQTIRFQGRIADREPG